jgi:hypothetical protein
MNYRVLFLSEKNEVQGFEDFDEADGRTAATTARTLAHGRRFELWRGSNIVASNGGAKPDARERHRAAL